MLLGFSFYVVVVHLLNDALSLVFTVVIVAVLMHRVMQHPLNNTVGNAMAVLTGVPVLLSFAFAVTLLSVQDLVESSVAVNRARARFWQAFGLTWATTFIATFILFANYYDWTDDSGVAVPDTTSIVPDTSIVPVDAAPDDQSSSSLRGAVVLLFRLFYHGQ